MRQDPKEDLDAYVRRFHDKALVCCNPMAEHMLVDVYLHGMIGDSEFI